MPCTFEAMFVPLIPVNVHLNRASVITSKVLANRRCNSLIDNMMDEFDHSKFAHQSRYAEWGYSRFMTNRHGLWKNATVRRRFFGTHPTRLRRYLLHHASARITEAVCRYMLEEKGSIPCETNPECTRAFGGRILMSAVSVTESRRYHLIATSADAKRWKWTPGTGKENTSALA